PPGRFLNSVSTRIESSGVDCGCHVFAARHASATAELGKPRKHAEQTRDLGLCRLGMLSSLAPPGSLLLVVRARKHGTRRSGFGAPCGASVKLGIRRLARAEP